MKKGLIFNIQRFSIHDGPGIRTTVFLKGCPLNCPWCANPESKSAKTQLLYTPANCIECRSCEAACPAHALRIENRTMLQDSDSCTHCMNCASACPTHALTTEGEWYSVKDVIAEVEKDRAFYEKSNGGVTLSGGEPLLQEEFTLDLLRALKAHGFHTNIETSGYTPTAYLDKILPYLDLIYMDLKHPDSNIHAKKVGVDNKLIVHNMVHTIVSGIPLVVRIPVIPRFNNDLETAHKYGQLLERIGADTVHLLPFHQMGLGKWRAIGLTYEYEHDKNMREDELKDMAQILCSYGLNVQISGS